MAKILLGLIILSLIGLGWFYFSRSSVLSEKQITAGGRKFSVLVPKNHIAKSGEKGFITAGSGKIISVALNILERKSSRAITCSDLKTQTAFYVFNNNFNKEIEICQSILKEKEVGKGMELIMLDAPGLTNQDYTYALAMGIRADYFSTSEGKEQAKKIFESFKIIN